MLFCVYIHIVKWGKEKEVWYDYVAGIAYEGHQVNFIERGAPGEDKATFYFLTDLPVTKRTVKELAEAGRRRRAIEKKGFNTQKKHGYHLEHRFSHYYQAWKQERLKEYEPEKGFQIRFEW